MVVTSGDAPEWIKIDDDQVQVDMDTADQEVDHQDGPDSMMDSVIEADSIDRTMGEIKTVVSMISMADIIMAVDSIM